MQTSRTIQLTLFLLPWPPRDSEAYVDPHTLDISKMSSPPNPRNCKNALKPPLGQKRTLAL